MNYKKYCDSKSRFFGEDFLKIFDDFMTKSNICYDTIASLSTDGASVITGKEQRLE